MSEYSVELKGLNKVYSNLLKEDTIALKDINLPDPSGGVYFYHRPVRLWKIDTFADHWKP